MLERQEEARDSSRGAEGRGEGGTSGATIPFVTDEGVALPDEPASVGARRRGWVAGLLSFFVVGLGQLRCGRGLRALALFASEYAVQTTCVLALVWIPVRPINLFTTLGLLVLWRGAVVRDAVLLARSVSGSLRPPWFSTAPVVIAVLVLWLYFGVEAFALVLRDHVAEAFRVPSRSMSDTLLPGDRFLSDKLLLREPARGDVVVYWVAAEGPSVRFVQRVIGLPGETVEVRGTGAWIDGRPLDEPYVKGEQTGPSAGRLAEWLADNEDRSERFGPVVVPAGHYFVLGDWRAVSRDSRREEVGFVARERIVASARTIFFSADPETGEVRWDRIGRVIR